MNAPPLTLRYAMDAAFISSSDGDSFHCRIRLPFKAEYVSQVRLARVNCAEAHALGGPEATAFTTAWLEAAMAAAPNLSRYERDWPLLVQGRNLDIRSRPLLEVYRKDTGANLSDDLLAQGFSQPYGMANALMGIAP
jgi:hypothetical protein